MSSFLPGFGYFLLSCGTFETFPFFTSTWTTGMKALFGIALVDPVRVSPSGRTGGLFASSTFTESAFLQGSSLLGDGS